MYGPLVAAASLAAGHELQGTQASVVLAPESRALAHKWHKGTAALQHMGYSQIRD